MQTFGFVAVLRNRRRRRAVQILRHRLRRVGELRRPQHVRGIRVHLQNLRAPLQLTDL